MKLTRPLVFIDIESATANPHKPDPQKDRIIEIGGLKYFPHVDGWDPQPISRADLCNPGIPIHQKCSDVHGYTDERVKDWPPFREFAKPWVDFIANSDVAGFNIWGYDLPLFLAECERNGVSFCWRSRLVVDAGMIMKKKEERSLEAAVRFYCGREHVGAHGAVADTQATIDVFKGQMERYPDVAAMSLTDLHKFCQYDDRERLTLDGSIVKGPDGDPIYTHRRVHGVKVKDDIGYADWMLHKAKFPRDTCEWLQGYLQQLHQEEEEDAFTKRREQADDEQDGLFPGATFSYPTN